MTRHAQPLAAQPPLAEYAGRYARPPVGEFLVAEADGRLVLAAGENSLQPPGSKSADALRARSWLVLGVSTSEKTQFVIRFYLISLNPKAARRVRIAQWPEGDTQGFAQQ